MLENNGKFKAKSVQIATNATRYWETTNPVIEQIIIYQFYQRMCN